MSKSSKSRAFHVSKTLLTAGALAGGVALGAGCKPEPEVTSNPAPITPPQTNEPEMELPKPVDVPRPVEPPINVNPGPMKAPIEGPDDMGAAKPAQDMTKAAAADLSAEQPQTPKLDRAVYRPNVNTQHISRRPPSPRPKKP